MPAHGLAQLHGNGVAQLNGQVADAAPRVEHVGLDQRAGGAGFDAQGASAAAVGQRVARRQLQIGHQDAEEKIGAQLGVDQAGILGLPTQAGVFAIDALQHRPGVHVELGLETWAGSLGHARPERFQLFFEHGVVVVAPRIAGNPAAFRVERNLGRAGVVSVVGQGAADHRAGVRQQAAGVAALGVAQVVERAGIAAFEPSGKESEFFQVSRRRDAHLVEAESAALLDHPGACYHRAHSTLACCGLHAEGTGTNSGNGSIVLFEGAVVCLVCRLLMIALGVSG